MWIRNNSTEKMKYYKKTFSFKLSWKGWRSRGGGGKTNRKNKLLWNWDEKVGSQMGRWEETKRKNRKWLCLQFTLLWAFQNVKKVLKNSKKNCKSSFEIQILDPQLYISNCKESAKKISVTRQKKAKTTKKSDQI